jgi:hypothetical protein
MTDLHRRAIALARRSWRALIESRDLVARSDYLSAASADLRHKADAARDRARRAIDNDAIAAEMDRTNG